jgi:hypothetical protein
MGMRKMAMAAALGLSMASAPVMAQSTSQPAPIERAGASLDQTNAENGGFPWLIIFVVIAAGLGLYFAVQDNGDGPTSP